MLKICIKGYPIPKKAAFSFLNMISIEFLPTHELNRSHPIYPQPTHRHLVPRSQPLYHTCPLLPSLGKRSAHHLPNSSTPSSSRNRKKQNAFFLTRIPHRHKKLINLLR